MWEETVGFDLKVELDPATMPHALRRLSDGTFEVSPVAWVEREVGDDVTNPLPSIVGQKTNKTVFFRNRFVFLAGENCVFSRANEYWNLFGLTAKTIVDSDPIDLLVASTYPSVLFDAIDRAPGNGEPPRAVEAHLRPIKLTLIKFKQPFPLKWRRGGKGSVDVGEGIGGAVVAACFEAVRAGLRVAGRVASRAARASHAGRVHRTRRGPERHC